MCRMKYAGGVCLDAHHRCLHGDAGDAADRALIMNGDIFLSTA